MDMAEKMDCRANEEVILGALKPLQPNFCEKLSEFRSIIEEPIDGPLCCRQRLQIDPQREAHCERKDHAGLVRNMFASRFYVIHLLASSFQTFFTNQSPAQTVFPLQEKRTVISFRSYDVNLSRRLIFESVPYFHQGTVSVLDLLGDYYDLRFLFTSSSTKGRNKDSMLFGLTSIE
jgi:hypothetical protein